MKTIEVTTTLKTQVQFPHKVPCYFKYSNNQDDPKLYGTDDFHSTHILKVDEDYKVSSIVISLSGFISERPEFDFNAHSVYNLNDIINGYKMPKVSKDWWTGAKKIVFDYWKSK